MLLKKALVKTKRSDGEKVGLNIKVPIEMKNEFDKQCKKHGTSMTAMMLALIETFIEESQGNYNPIEVEFVRLARLRLQELNEKIAYLKDNFDPYYADEYQAMLDERSKLYHMLEDL